MYVILSFRVEQTSVLVNATYCGFFLKKSKIGTGDWGGGGRLKSIAAHCSILFFSTPLSFDGILYS